MSGARPAVVPALLVAATEAVTARARKRLDANPRLAEGWAWSEVPGGLEVRTDTGEVVRLRPQQGRLSTAEELGCSCLLGPRCLHVLAVVSLLPAQLAEAPVEVAAPVVEAAARVALSPVQARAVAAGLAVVGDLLQLGAAQAGLVLLAELSRVAADLGACGAFRPARALLGLLGAARLARDGDADGLVEALGLAARSLFALAGPEAPAAAFGQGRRAFDPLPGLRLFGLLAEPLGRGDGGEGVLTLLCASKGGLSAVADWGGEARASARQLYQRGSRLGPGAPSPEALSRGGLHLVGGTVSSDRRLGAPEGLSLVSAEGALLWEEPLAALFAEPWPQQRARMAAALFDEAPPAGADLAYLRGQLVGTLPEGLVLAHAGGLSLLLPESDRPERPDREGLRRLARVGPIEVFAIGRAMRERPWALRLLCLGSPALPLPPAMKGRLNLAFDRVSGLTLPDAPPLPALTPPPPPARPTEPLLRRLRALAQGGVAVLGPSLLPTVEAEARALDAALLSGGAERLRALAAACLPGVDRRRPDPARLLRAWVQAQTYTQAVTASLWAEADG